MKKILTFCLIVLTNQIFAQLNFKTAKSESGIVKSEAGGLNIGYSFSESEARFTYSTTKDTLVISGKKAGRNIFNGTNVKLIVPITDGTNGIYSGGSFSPGVGIAYELIHNKDQFKNDTWYNFIGASYTIKQNNFANIGSDNLLTIKKKLTQTISVTPGFNLLFGGKHHHDDLIIAGSLALQYNIKPVVDLKSKDITIYNSIATNGVVQKTEKGFIDTQDDFFSVLPKVDFVWTPFLTKTDGIESGARIGFLGSLSSRYNATKGKFACNGSIGPSIHPMRSSSSVIATLQAEFTDFNNSTNDKTLNDIFSVNFYIGIPLAFK